MQTTKMKTTRSSPKIVLALWLGAALLSLMRCNTFSQTTGLPRDAEATLRTADSFTLFSVDPDSDFEHETTNSFQRHIILGQLEIKSKRTRKILIDALNEGITAYQKSLSPGAPTLLPNCFNPRHAIRAKKGEETVELLICFECRQILVTSRSGTNQLFVTTADPAATFNKVLNNAGILVAGDDGVYFVDGEVAHPGPRQYLGEISVIEAIQAAGGFTPSASHVVWILHPDGKRVRVDVDKPPKDEPWDAIVYPEDQINVPRRPD